MKVSIIIINWNTRELLRQCLDTVFALTAEIPLEVIVVDNASSDDSLTMLQEGYPQVRVIANTHNVGFARANNQGVAASQSPYALLLNSDAFLLAQALPRLMSILEAEPQAGLVGAHLINRDGSFQASHTAFPTLGREFLILSGLGRLIYGRHYPSYGPQIERGPQKADYVEGACMLVRREAYLAVGGLDEGYFMYSEEVDLCYALQHAGWQVWYHPLAQVTHWGGASSQNRKPQREGDLYTSRVRFFRKHYGARSAHWLKQLIYLFTGLKIIGHRLLRWLSGGRWGRPVVSLDDLVAKLKDV